MRAQYHRLRPWSAGITRGPIWPEPRSCPLESNESKIDAVETAPSQQPAIWPWRAMWRHRWLVLLGLVLCLGGGIGYVRYVPPLYRATARVSVEQRGPAGMRSSGSNFIMTQRELMVSPAVLIHVLPDADEMKVLEGKDPSKRLAALKDVFEITPEKGTDILAVSASSPNPDEADKLVKSLVVGYSLFLNNPTPASSEKRAELTQTKARLAEDEAKFKSELASFQKDHGNNSAVEAETARKTASKLAEDLGGLTAKTVKAKGTRDEAVAALGGDPVKTKRVAELLAVSGLVTDEQIRQLQDQLVELVMKKQALESEHLTPDHPSLIALATQIDDLKVRYAVSTEKLWRTLDEDRRNAKVVFDPMDKQAKDLEAVARRAKDLDEIGDRIHQQQASVETQLDQLVTAQAAAVPQLTPLYEKETPLVSSDQPPYWPDRTLVLAVALAAGLFLGCLFAYAAESIAPRVQTQDELVNTLGLPVLAALPHVPDADDIRLSGAEIGEGYRAVARTVATATGAAKTLLITSPGEGDGKTSVSSRLAAALALNGERVLLVDANLRDPRLHVVFGMDNNLGLSTILTRVKFPEAAVRPTPVAGLDVILSGPLPKTPTDMLKSQAFEDFLRDMSGKYDRVILDSPGVRLSNDSRIIGAACDSTLLVVRARKLDRRGLEQAHDALMSVGATIAGVIANDVVRRGKWQVNAPESPMADPSDDDMRSFGFQETHGTYPMPVPRDDSSSRRSQSM